MSSYIVRTPHDSGGTPRGAEGLLGRAESVQAPSTAKQAAPLPQSAPPPQSAKAPSAVQQQAALLEYIFPSLALLQLQLQLQRKATTYADTLVDSRIRNTQSQIITCCRGAVLWRHMLSRAMLRISCRSYPHVDQLCPSALRVSPASGVFVSCF